ncbi:MAG: UDP-N-acetylglucosamine--N-acetylmuramyl-(pentapeptide) pyrophosphoryl-undecaprenol N-acetylglucosamine transferase [Bacteroidetes bacterium ADurb.Bin397]|nr:glycosyl transferase [Bacteroidota bacterium]OQA11573.1 MAG: UDP-N-acetylglucosamine--N-acetylmuramyl-(pentapeptide) pyrophosphoryl-undecaprenol N-acetylglucosamine transferase [Bacteroidetes bacterium ADurb.Bin397]
MKILYGIQGTGNGHLTRAMELIPHLQQKGDVEILISGEQYDLPLTIEPTYRMKGLYFVFGKNGGIDLKATFNKINSFRFIKEIRNFPIEKYDLVISDFEPVSAWACNRANKNCIGLSNQAATLHPLAPKPKTFDPLGKLILEYYAPTTVCYGFHFKKLSPQIFTPIIRKEVRALKPENTGHFTVYLPSYDDTKIIKHLKKFDHLKWQVFSKHCKKAYKVKNIQVHPIQGQLFMNSIASASGIISNAGFGATSEALFLGKKLLVIPMKNQYEQQCNAAMLKSMGVATMKSMKSKHHAILEEWVDAGQVVKVDYKDQSAAIVDTILKNHKF